MKTSSPCRLATALFALVSLPSSAHAFDCPVGAPNICAPATVIDFAVDKLLETVAPGDAPLILRTTTLVAAGWFDAIAPYSANAVGVHSDLGRLPTSGGDSERNIAIMYASHEVLNSLMPQFAGHWDAMMGVWQLDPDDNSTDVSTPIGVGNVAGAAVVAAREGDGMNQLGDEEGSPYFRRPYSDYTGYAPVNSGELLKDARLWQPDTLTNGNGIFFSQQFVTPQLGVTQPFSYDSVTRMAPVPKDSYAVTPSGKLRPQYRAQAEEVLAVQAALTDRQKLISEFFDNKIISLGFSTLAATLAHQLSLEQFVQLDYLVNVASFDTAITIWHNKRHYDAVRPFTAIGVIYGEDTVTAWGGPGEGTVDDVKGNRWRPYLQSANHPEYPSASASFCRAHATSTKLYLEQVVGLSATDANALDFWVPGLLGPDPEFEVLYKPPGSSIIEPDVTPHVETTLGWATWDDFAYECGLSRLWAGVHFFASIPAGQDIGDPIGAEAYDWLKSHIDGTVE
jgi:hypothetical protein